MPQESILSKKVYKNKGINSEEKRWIIKQKLRSRLLGTAQKQGLISQVLIYLLLISIGFIYLYPLLYMFSTSMMSLGDLLDSSVRWIPTSLYTKNYRDALMVMDYWNSLMKNLVIALAPAILQTAICSLTAYGFARFNFKGKKLLMGIMILTFVIPPQILMMPTYLLYSDMGLVGSLNAFLLPALFGQGLQSAVMILIFYQFYVPIPDSLIEAAQIDGASQLRIYGSIGIRSALPAIIVVFIFSFVFYWNETYLTAMYLGNHAGVAFGTDWTTLLLELNRFQQSYEAIYPVAANSGNRLNEAIRFAGTILSILPLIFLSGILQKYLVESIDSSGITGE